MQADGLSQGTWNQIYAAIREAQSSSQISQGVVSDRDETKRVVWVRELSSDPIPVVGQSNNLTFYSGKQRKVTKIPPAVPQIGDVVLLIRTINGSFRCVGVLSPAAEWAAPGAVGFLAPGAVGASELSPDIFPWLIDVNVFGTPISHINWDTNVADATAVMGGHKDSSGAQNDEISFDIVLAAGTWTFELIYVAGSDTGIFSILLDGTLIGTHESYVGALAVPNVQTPLSGIVIGTTGKKRLTLKMASKNALSSSYKGMIQHIQLRRTA